MRTVAFLWDERKNSANKRKHGVGFEEAQTVFSDENALEFPDPDHSQDESRFLMLGFSYRLRVLVVCHCVRPKELEIRIISARKATKKEKMAYGEGVR